MKVSSSPSRRPSWVTSILSLSLILLVTLFVIQWHSENDDEQQRRHLIMQTSTMDGVEATTITDDSTRDSVCKEYLMNFLNGTTDAKDECQGMLNAYQAADCADDKNTGISVGRKHHHNDNSTDDDVLIDDFYEHWECCNTIYEYYTRHCHEQPQLASYQLLGVVSVLLVCGFVKSLLRALKIEWIPDAAVCIVVGAIVGGILKLIDPTLISEKLSFNNNLFLHILLPPIVFHASLTIDKRAFQRDLFPILTFAIAGTLLSTVFVGLLTHSVTSIGGGGGTLPLLESILFGSLISSIDPVATLGILSAVGVSQTDTLYTLVFGESLLNDGVAIVLFDTLVGHLGNASVVSRASIHETAVHFVRIFAGSLGIGLACGMVCTVYFWALSRKHTSVVEVGVFFCWAFIPFYISDGIGDSGIISIMTMGFFLDYFVIGGSQSEETEWMDYMAFASSERLPEQSSRPSQVCCSFVKAFSGKGHMSTRSRHHVKFVAEIVASFMETAVFAYTGVFLFNDKTMFDFRLNTIGVFASVSSRAFMVAILSVLINLFVWFDIQGHLGRLFCRNRENDDDSVESMGSTASVYLDKKTQQILILAGARGAVSFALVESIPVYDAVTKEGSLYKPQLKSMTSCSILFTIFVFGAWTYFLIKGEKDEQTRQRGPLAHRLLSAPLISGDEDSDASDAQESSP